MRILAAMEPPRRTIRGILFANEENGLRGGLAYFEAHGEERHVAAIETDLGGGWPLGWGGTGSAEQLTWLGVTAAPLGLPVASPGGGADISPLKKTGTLVVGLRPDDTHYFDVHHTHADTLDKVDRASLEEGAAALAGLAWLLAEAPNAPGPTGEPHED
jgi:Zn-dependent M28 family amino/carboxypeptidase